MHGGIRVQQRPLSGLALPRLPAPCECNPRRASAPVLVDQRDISPLSHLSLGGPGTGAQSPPLVGIRFDARTVGGEKSSEPGAAKKNFRRPIGGEVGGTSGGWSSPPLPPQ